MIHVFKNVINTLLIIIMECRFDVIKKYLMQSYMTNAIKI
jgi:hypothetical protein